MDPHKARPCLTPPRLHGARPRASLWRRACICKFVRKSPPPPHPHCAPHPCRSTSAGAPAEGAPFQFRDGAPSICTKAYPKPPPPWTMRPAQKLPPQMAASLTAGALLLAPAAACCCCLLLLPAVAGRRCWALLLPAAVARCRWPLLLPAAAGLCCWPLLRSPVAGRCCCPLCCPLLLAAARYCPTPPPPLHLCRKSWGRGWGGGTPGAAKQPFHFFGCGTQSPAKAAIMSHEYSAADRQSDAWGPAEGAPPQMYLSICMGIVGIGNIIVTAPFQCASCLPPTGRWRRQAQPLWWGLAERHPFGLGVVPRVELVASSMRSKLSA